jgi:hypothetical protein
MRDAGCLLLLPGGREIALAACMLCVWLMSQSDRAAWVSTIVCLVLGTGVAYSARWRTRVKA